MYDTTNRPIAPAEFTKTRLDVAHAMVAAHALRGRVARELMTAAKRAITRAVKRRRTAGWWWA